MGNLDDYINSLLFDNSVTTLTPRQRIDEAQAQFDAAIKAGNSEASILTSQKLLKLARDGYGSSSGYQAIYDDTTESLKCLRDAINKEKLTDSEKRMEGLIIWLGNQEFDPSNHNMTKTDIWGKLNKFDDRLFPPLSESSIEGFFKFVKKEQPELISFKSGRRTIT